MNNLRSEAVVEVAAKAMYYNGLTDDMPDWRELHESERNLHRSYAKAAIEAMLTAMQMSEDQAASNALTSFERHARIGGMIQFSEGYLEAYRDLGLVKDE